MCSSDLTYDYKAIDTYNIGIALSEYVLQQSIRPHLKIEVKISEQDYQRFKEKKQQNPYFSERTKITYEKLENGKTQYYAVLNGQMSTCCDDPIFRSPSFSAQENLTSRLKTFKVKLLQSKSHDFQIQLIDIALSCLTYEPEKRINTTALIQALTQAMSYVE